MNESNSGLPEPLRTMISTYFDVELFWHSFPSELHTFLAANPDEAAQFKAQFAAAFVDETFSLDEYQRLTSQTFGNEGELYVWLSELWTKIYGDEPIPGDT